MLNKSNHTTVWLVQWLKLLTLISADGVQFLVEAAVVCSVHSAKKRLITAVHVVWSACKILDVSLVFHDKQLAIWLPCWTIHTHNTHFIAVIESLYRGKSKTRIFHYISAWWRHQCWAIFFSSRSSLVFQHKRHLGNLDAV